jgi:hypothetical protein
MDTAIMPVVASNNTAGRPELYPTIVKPKFDDIYEWISQGNTEKSICKRLGIHPFTWICYKKEYTELTELITRARTAAGDLLLNKQFAAACGQTVTLYKQKVTKDGDVVDIAEDMYIPPNVNAADFWSRHMMPGYIPPKSVESGNITINNIQLPQLEADIQAIQSKRKELETLLAVDVEVIED